MDEKEYEEKVNTIFMMGIGRTSLPDEENIIKDALKKTVRMRPEHITHEFEGQEIVQVGCDGYPYDLCPGCGINLCTDGPQGLRRRHDMHYCQNCGQKLDFTEKIG